MLIVPHLIFLDITPPVAPDVLANKVRNFSSFLFNNFAEKRIMTELIDTHCVTS